MPTLALDRLPLPKARSFVPRTCRLGRWEELEPLFRKLEAEASGLRGPRDLENWVLRISEFAAALEQEGTKRYIRMSCQTDDKAIEKEFLHFVEQIEPQVKPRWNALSRLFLACPHHKRLPRRRWMVFEREIRNEVKLFRPKNVALQVKEAKLEQRYQKTMGAMTVNFQGREQTLQQMSRYLEETDRGLREEAWKKIAQRRLQDRDALEGIFDRLKVLRHAMARNAGFRNYRDYAFPAKGRFDYTPADCFKFHAAVEQWVAPLAREIQDRRRRLMGLTQLRPWDLGVDARNRPPLKPFTGVPALVEKTHRIFRKIDPSLGRDFALLRTHGLLDLDSRKGKAPGGYQATLEEARLPFIFMNAVGLHRDVETLLHEGGHAFHSLATRREPLLAYRHAPIEFCEVASMSMELLASPHLGEFYSPADADRARRAHLEGIVSLLPWIALIDAFQHWIYTHPGEGRAARKAAWMALHRRFGGIEDWTGLETEQAYLWHRQMHLFGSPFYYIEYGIAQLGALQVWLNARRNTRKAVARYRAALALGRSRPLPELFRAAGARFDFSARAIRPLIQALGQELRRLDQA